MSRDNPFHPGRMAQDIATLAKQLDMRRWDQEYLGITKSERDFRPERNGQPPLGHLFIVERGQDPDPQRN